MKNMGKIMKEAHKLTREIKGEFPEVDYKTQLGICISYLLNEREGNNMVELQGTEKQVKWANDIRKEILETVNNILNDEDEKHFFGEVGVLNKAITSVEDSTFFIENRRLAKLVKGDDKWNSLYYGALILAFDNYFKMFNMNKINEKRRNAKTDEEKEAAKKLRRAYIDKKNSLGKNDKTWYFEFV